ncbi:hypothetical protein ACJMK2_034066, partial [Sinanodonta woodiana]
QVPHHWWCQNSARERPSSYEHVIELERGHLSTLKWTHALDAYSVHPSTPVA